MVEKHRNINKSFAEYMCIYIKRILSCISLSYSTLRSPPCRYQPSLAGTHPLNNNNVQKLGKRDETKNAKQQKV